jgi:hypothetical protein
VLGRGASDESLLKANDTIRKMFAYRHDVLKALIAHDVKLIVLGRQEKIPDLPEFQALPGGLQIDALARSLDYSPAMKLLVVAEENVLADPRQANVGDNQVIRAFASAIYHVLGSRPVDPDWTTRPRNVWQQYELGVERLDSRFAERLGQLHEQVLSLGKWKGTSAVHDPLAYWLTGVLAYFDAPGQQVAPQDGAKPIQTREAFQAYDSDLYELVHQTFAYGGRVEWRFRP